MRDTVHMKHPRVLAPRNTRKYAHIPPKRKYRQNTILLSTTPYTMYDCKESSPLGTGSPQSVFSAGPDSPSFLSEHISRPFSPEEEDAPPIGRGRTDGRPFSSAARSHSPRPRRKASVSFDESKAARRRRILGQVRQNYCDGERMYSGILMYLANVAGQPTRRLERSSPVW